MPAMRSLYPLILMMLTTVVVAEAPALTENDFRGTLGLRPEVRMSYRDLSCKGVDFEGFKAAMQAPGTHADVERAVDGSAVTLTVVLRGAVSCPSSYPPIAAIPPFDLQELDG